jgi:hypothetical protein
MAVLNRCPAPPAYLLLLPQVAVNNDITDVWAFYDTHRMFADWAGVLSKLYMSSAALVTGWVSGMLLAGNYHSEQLRLSPSTTVADQSAVSDVLNSCCFGGLQDSTVSCTLQLAARPNCLLTVRWMQALCSPHLCFMVDCEH